MVSKIKIQEVSMSGCNCCADAKDILEEVKKQFPDAEIEYIDMLSERGQKMVQEYTIMASPGIVVNGKLFSSGGLKKDKLVEKINSLSS